MFKKDSQWSRQAFLVPDSDYPEAEQFLRTFNTADLKYHDTTIGGSSVLNPLPQFTRYADPPIKGIFNPGSTGMGGTYSEAFDDNMQILYLRFGVPKFNSMTTFFTGFYNYRASVIARTGRVPEGFYFLGALAATATIAVGFFVFPLFTALAAGLSMVGYAARFMLNKPSSKYYYLKPTMITFWSVATLILNYLVINMGFLSQQADPSDVKLRNTDNRGLTPDERSYMNKMMPDIFKKDGTIDVFAIASKGQRMAREQEALMSKLLSETAPDNGQTWFGKAFENIVNVTLGPNTVLGKDAKNVSLASYLAEWKATSEGTVQPNAIAEVDSRKAIIPRDSNGDVVGNTQTGDVEVTISDGAPTVNSTNSEIVAQEASFLESTRTNLSKFFQAEHDDGGAFLALRVDYTGQQSESFSNSTTDSEIKSKINSISSSSRSSLFNLSGGNLADLGALGSVLGFGVDVVKDTLGGIADASGLSGIMALGGSAFVDIPKHWQDSSFSGPKMSYTITLDAIYNHPVARIMNQLLPLSCLLAGTMALGTGKQSYTSPFICEGYDRGRAVSRLAIMRDLNINRGTGNLGFLNSGISLAMEVSFSLEDLSSTVAAPLNAFYSANPVASVFDDDNTFSDYMAVLTGMGLTDMIYPSNKVARNWKRNMLNLKKFSSPAFWGSVFANKTPARVLSILYRGVDKN